MELRQLRYFVEIASGRSMREAAKRLHIAQPALSRQLQSLETEIGHPLFNRKGRSLELTATGTAFVQEAKQVLQTAEAALLFAKRTAEGTRGVVRIGLIDTAAWEGPFPAGIRSFHREHPEVSLSLTPMFSKVQLLQIDSGQIDGGFCYAMEKLPKHFDFMRLRIDTLQLAVPSWSKLANLPAVPVGDLVGESFIWVRRENAPAYVLAKEKALEKAGLNPRIVQAVEDETSLLSLVAAGVGLAFVNSANAARKPESVTLRPVVGLRLHLPLVFAWRRDNDSPSLRALIRALEGVTTKQSSKRAS